MRSTETNKTYRVLPGSSPGDAVESEATGAPIGTAKIWNVIPVKGSQIEME